MLQIEHRSDRVLIRDDGDVIALPAGTTEVLGTTDAAVLEVALLYGIDAVRRYLRFLTDHWSEDGTPA